MDKAAFGFLSELLATPTVTGFEQAGAAVVRKWLKPHVDEVRTDVHGNTFFCLNPKGKVRVMIASHIDQIGFMVNHITEKGFLHLVPVGGIDVTVVPGLRLMVHGKDGPVQGVVGRKAIHLMKEEERGGGKKIDLADLPVDVGAGSRAEVEKMGIKVGDPVTYVLGLARLGEDLITAAALDDRVGVWVMAEALRIIDKDPKKRKRLKAAVYGVATVQEEIGLRGALTAANQLEPQVGIAVDVTHATDSPGIEEKNYGSVKMGGGPTVCRGPNINEPLNKVMVKAAEAVGVKVQWEAAPRATGTDANTMQISRGGVATALLSLPCRYMHTPVEVVSLKDLQAAAEVLAETVLSIDERSDFVPA